jgi:sarcosine oxidase, subunit beta
MNDRSGEEVVRMSGPRIVVIGGGAAGLSAAYHLSASGCDSVTVLERDHIGAGASGRSAGIVETQFLEPFDIEVRAIGRRFVDAMAADHGLLFTRNGYLRLGESDEMLERFARSVDLQREFGIDDAAVLTRDEVGRLVPDLRVDDRAGGLLGASDGYLDGYLLTSLYATLARRNGADIRQRCALRGVDSADDGSYRLTTDSGVLDADVVVNAAGAWAAAVGEMLDAPVPISPLRVEGVLVHTGRPLPYQLPSVMDHVPGSGRDGLWFRPEAPGVLMAGLITEQVPDAADADSVPTDPDPTLHEIVAGELAHRLPGLADAGLGKSWAGLCPMSPDIEPIVGPHPANDAVICALGGGGHGIQLSPAIGLAVAHFVTDGRSDLVPPGGLWDPRRIGATTDAIR